jgi:hypothetical protein
MRMAARRIVFLSFVAGSIFVAAAMWMYRDEAKPAGALTPDRVGDRATSTAARQDHPESTKRALRARSEDLERASLELAELSTAGSPDDFFEIVIVTPGGTERLFVEGGALGAELLGTRGRPNP